MKHDNLVNTNGKGLSILYACLSKKILKFTESYFVSRLITSLRISGSCTFSTSTIAFTRSAAEWLPLESPVVVYEAYLPTPESGVLWMNEEN